MVYSVIKTSTEQIKLISQAVMCAKLLGDEAHPNVNTWKVRRCVPFCEHVCTNGSPEYHDSLIYRNCGLCVRS